MIFVSEGFNGKFTCEIIITYSVLSTQCYQRYWTFSWKLFDTVYVNKYCMLHCYTVDV